MYRTAGNHLRPGSLRVGIQQLFDQESVLIEALVTAGDIVSALHNIIDKAV